jgi:hypothetical protein
MAKRTHRGTKYCSATRVFVEMSRISPGVWAIRQAIGTFASKKHRRSHFGYFFYMKRRSKPYRFLPGPQRKIISEG